MLRANVVRLLEQLGGLLQIDDVDAAALGEDEAAHLRVPAARLVAEVDSGLQQLPHGDDGHGTGPFLGWVAMQPAGRGRNRPGPAPPPVLVAGTEGKRRGKCSGAQSELAGALERGREVVGQRRLDLDPLPGERMVEREPGARAGTAARGRGRRDAVDRVAGDRQVDRGEMDADLVRPPGLEP